MHNFNVAIVDQSCALIGYILLLYRVRQKELPDLGGA